MAELPDAKALFDGLVDDLLGWDGVEPPRGGSGFGRNSLKVNNKIFAMYVRDRRELPIGVNGGRLAA